jgi:hypothetical protein
MDEDPLIVETYAGYKAERTPRAFLYEGLRRKVISVADTWYTNNHCYFRLCADDGYHYVMRHEFEKDQWELVMRER